MTVRLRTEAPGLEAAQRPGAWCAAAPGAAARRPRARRSASGSGPASGATVWASGSPGCLLLEPLLLYPLGFPKGASPLWSILLPTHRIEYLRAVPAAGSKGRPPADGTQAPPVAPRCDGHRRVAT